MADPNLDYAVTVEPLPAEEGGGYVAYVPDLPGCISDGETQMEALLNASDGIVQWIDQARAMHRPIPAPIRRRTFA